MQAEESFDVLLTPERCVVVAANAIAPSRASPGSAQPRWLRFYLIPVKGTDKLQATDKHDVMQFR